MKRFLFQAGFTMIELLVVIAVIGVLAVAVLSSINPIEQINKGRDTRTRSDAAQLINGVDRFFATQEMYPWNDPNYACGTGATCSLSTTEQDPATQFPLSGSYTSVCTPNGTAPGVGLCKVNTTGGLWMDGLTGTSEVKGGFTTRIKAQTTYAIYVYKPATTAKAMYSCFRPSSLSFQNEALKNCRDSAITTDWDATLKAAACPGTGTVGTSGYTQSTLKNELICLP